MTVIELIAELGRLPPDMDVCVWDHDEDEYMPVVEALLEDGSTHVDLLVRPSGAVPAEMIDCPACRGYDQLVAEVGFLKKVADMLSAKVEKCERDERTLIVKWLREEARRVWDSYASSGRTSEGNAVEAAAVGIEIGAHRPVNRER